MAQLLIFDLDGTLVDSKKDIAVSLNRALEQEGFSPLPQKQIEDLVGWGAKHLVREALGHPSDEELQRVFASFWQHYDQNLLNETALYPGVRDFLEHSDSWRKAVITNKPFIWTEKILAGLKLDSFFEWVIGGDSLAVQKPDPAVLGPIQKDLGEIARGIMIGDSLVDLEFGKSIGFKTCAVTHGFGLAEELRVAEPDFLVEDFSQWRDLLNQFN